MIAKKHSYLGTAWEVEQGDLGPAAADLATIDLRQMRMPPAALQRQTANPIHHGHVAGAVRLASYFNLYRQVAQEAVEGIQRTILVTGSPAREYAWHTGSPWSPCHSFHHGAVASGPEWEGLDQVIVRVVSRGAGLLPQASVEVPVQGAFLESLGRLDEIAALTDDWDGEGALAPCGACIERARSFLLIIGILADREAIDEPWIAVGVDGSIGIEWTHGGRELALSFERERTGYVVQAGDLRDFGKIDTSLLVTLGSWFLWGVPRLPVKA